MIKGTIGGTLSGLTSQQSSDLVYQFSGAMTYPNGLTILKGINDLKSILKTKFAQIKTNIQNDPNIPAAYSASILDGFNIAAAQVDSLKTTDDVYQLSMVISTSESQIRASALPSTVQTALINDINNAKLMEAVYSAFDMSSYIPNLVDIDQFYSDVYNSYQTSAASSSWYNNLMAPYANDINKQLAAIMALEIPYGSDAKNE